MEKAKITLYLAKKKVKLDDGKTFDAFKTQFGRLNVDVKFTKNCKDVPKKSGYCQFDAERLNINTQKDYPVIWIKAE